MESEARYQLGYSLGLVIYSLFKIVASIDNLPVRDAIDHWVSVYVSERIQDID